jgi:hypothetical protein
MRKVGAQQMLKNGTVQICTLVAFSATVLGCTKGGFKASTFQNTSTSLSSALPEALAVPAKLVSTAEDTPVVIATDSLGQTAAIDLLVLTMPSNGSVAFNAGTRSFTYTPRANFNGRDLFAYGTSAQDKLPQPVSITVVAVNDAPTISAQNLSAISGRALQGNFATSDVDGTPLQVNVTTPPRFGTLQIAANGTSFSYTGAINTYGNDSFVVTVSDGAATSGTATINLNVAENVDEATVSRNLLPDCMTSRLHNTCLFWKNPVAQATAPFASGPIGPASVLTALQTHAVNIPRGWYDNSGFLRNSSFNVFVDTPANTAARVSTSSGSFKYAYSDDPDRKLSQVITFYWLMTQARFMKQRVGSFFAENTNVQVFASDPAVVNNGYYFGSLNQIRMGRTGTAGAANSDYATGAEIALHEMGHANLAHATGMAIYVSDVANAKDRNCGPQTSPSVCCVDKNGCSTAINEGQADHHANIVFNQETGLGQHLTNTLAGISSCNVSRDTAANTTLTVTQAYSACSDPVYAGRVHVLGSVYASIWYELRKLARAANATEAVEIDRLFNEHLKTITGNDNFSSAYTKIRAIDTALFAGKFGARVQAEFTKRNIDIAM